MSKLFYRLKSLLKYLKHNNLLDDNYEPFILITDDDKVIIEEYKKLIHFFHDINDSFKEKYISFIDIYEQELIDNKKRDIAKNELTKLLQEYKFIYGIDSKPTDKYIYTNIKLSNDLKYYLNLSTSYNENNNKNDI
jgi:hypothetical protein